MSKKTSRRNLLIASAAAGLFLTGAVAAPAQAAEEQVRCYGINACKGHGECGGKGHSCAGENQCKGKGYLKLSKDKCLKIQNARLTPDK